MPASGVTLPTDTVLLRNVRLVEPTSIGGADVIVATADKWAYSRQKVLTVGRPDAGIVDEAYQMTSAKLLRIADVFPTLDMVGDPGQLDPFSTIDEDRWVGLPQNPVRPMADYLWAIRTLLDGGEETLYAYPFSETLTVFEEAGRLAAALGQRGDSAANMSCPSASDSFVGEP